MKYIASLVVNGRVVRTSEIKHNGQMTIADMKKLGDSLYFRYVEGPRGPAEYPAADLVLTSKAPILNQRLRRRADSNAAGFPDLWTQVRFEEAVVT